MLADEPPGSTGRDNVGGTDVPRASVAALRRFARFYTRHAGLLEPGLYGTSLTLTEARILYELARGEGSHAVDIARLLALDRAQLSRTFARFEKAGWIRREADRHDRRRAIIKLTRAGKALFRSLDHQADHDVAAMLKPLPGDVRQILIPALATAEHILAAAAPSPIVIRDAAIGDLGLIIHRHAVLYARDYGWNRAFEALVAEIASTYIRDFAPDHDGCWIAERDGAFLGCVMLVRAGPDAARLRLLLVEPQARGPGLGGRLVDHCIAAAKARSYRRLVLWTNDILVAARALYVRRGFVLTASEPHDSFGHHLVGETWELSLESD